MNLQAVEKDNYMIILWQDENGDIREDDYSIGQPFEINFEHDQWVRKIKRLDNGSIVVFVEKQQLIQNDPRNTVPEPNTQPDTNPALNSYWCDDLSGVKLKVGDSAKITWDKVNLRSTPKVPDVWEENIVAELEQGTSLTIIDGPECAHEGTWWKVRANNGKTGWIREYISAGYLMER